MFDKTEMRLLVMALRNSMDAKLRRLKELQWIVEQMDCNDNIKRDLERVENQFNQMSELYKKSLNQLVMMK